MLDATAEALKAFLLPGSPWPLLLLATVCALLGLLVLRRARALAIVLAAVCATYWLGSLPAISNGLATGFGRLPFKPITSEQLQGVQAIVVLGAGANSFESGGRVVTTPSEQTALNALEGVRVFMLANRGVDVIASGGIVS